MKKNRFLLLVVFALFVFLPFNVNAEVNSVKKIGSKVYVVKDFELDIKCSGVQEPEYYSLGVENLIEVYDLSDDEEYIYDFTTKECRLMTEEEIDKYWAEEPEISYEIKNNKLYKIETDAKFRQYYVEVSIDKIVDDGVYYKNPERLVFEKVSSDECLNSDVVCYEQKDLYQVNYYKDDGNNYYLWEGYRIVSLLDSEPENAEGGIYTEANIDDYVKETVIIDNVSEFDKKANMSMSLEEIIDVSNESNAKIDVLTLNNEVYIYTYYEEDGLQVTNLYSADGTKIETDFAIGEFRVIGNYLVGAGFKDMNSNSGSLIYYNYNFENIYEVNNIDFDTVEELVYFTNYENSTIILLEKEIENENYSDWVYSYIVINEYELLQGEEQKYANDNLIFKTNGDFSLFNNVEINGIELETSNYVVEKGSTIVTLKNDYLKTLSNGTYNLKINYTDGGYVETTFKVEKTGETQSGNGSSQLEENPKTFDDIGSSIFMGTISLIALIGATIYLRSKNKVRAN